MRQFLSILLVLAAGLSGLAVATDGLQAFTTEGARRLAVSREPRALPDILLEDSQGQRFTLHSLKGRLLVIDFFYTGCDTLCTALGGSFSLLQKALHEAKATDVLLLSVTFDPKDDQQDLLRYAQRYQADAALWHFVRPVRADDLPVLLEAFGITVLPSPVGGFEHNAALHVVDTESRLAHIADYDRPDEVAAFLAL